MADDPIIIDDGGSTRIKKRMREGSVGAMDALLEVRENIGSPAEGRPGSKVTTMARREDYGTITITYIDIAGQPFVFEGRPLPFTTFEIVSGNHLVNGGLVPNPNGDGLQALQLTVSCNVGNEPNIDVKQHRLRRRYVVTNAKEIDEVRITHGTETKVFNANSKSPEGRDIIYTSLVVT